MTRLDNGGRKTDNGGRGKTNVEGRLAGLGQKAQQAGAADWRVPDLRYLHAIVCEVTKRGGMASFGLSRDKGAYNITILLDSDRRTIWVSGSEDCDSELEKIVHFLASMPE